MQLSSYTPHETGHTTRGRHTRGGDDDVQLCSKRMGRLVVVTIVKFLREVHKSKLNAFECSAMQCNAEMFVPIDSLIVIGLQGS